MKIEVMSHPDYVESKGEKRPCNSYQVIDGKKFYDGYHVVVDGVSVKEFWMDDTSVRTLSNLYKKSWCEMACIMAHNYSNELDKFPVL